jgi:hypothetical protein
MLLGGAVDVVRKDEAPSRMASATIRDLASESTRDRDMLFLM